MLTSIVVCAIDENGIANTTQDGSVPVMLSSSIGFEKYSEIATAAPEGKERKGGREKEIGKKKNFLCEQMNEMKEDEIFAAHPYLFPMNEP
jgi:hypothetical protein